VPFTFNSVRPYEGAHGNTPTEAVNATELHRYCFKPYHVTKGIQRMNKRLKAKLEPSKRLRKKRIRD